MGDTDSGFTLVEVLVALAIMVAVSTGVVRLFAVATAAGRESRDRTMAVTLAASRLEELRSLSWGYEVDLGGAAVARTDLATDLSTDPAGGSGPGLAESPSGTLDVDTPPYVEYLDASGQRVGSGSAPPSAVYVRRWAVRHYPGNERLLSLQVFVTTVRRARLRGGRAVTWTGEDALLATVVSRKAR